MRMKLHLERLKLSLGHLQLRLGELGLQPGDLELFFLMTAVVVDHIADQENRSITHEPGRQVEKNVGRVELRDRRELLISRYVKQPADDQIDGAVSDRQNDAAGDVKDR